MAVITFEQGWDWTRKLEHDARDAFFSGLRLEKFEPGTIISSQGGAADKLYYIHSGVVVLQANDPDGKQIVLTLQGAGTTLGDVPLVIGFDMVYTSVALTHVEAGSMSRDEFQKLRAMHSGVDTQLMLRYARMIRHITLHLNDMILLSTQDRLIQLIQSAAHFYAQGQPDVDWVAIPLSQQDVSNALGVTRQSTHRLLSTLTESGAVTFRSGSMHISTSRLAKLK